MCCSDEIDVDAEDDDEAVVGVVVTDDTEEETEDDEVAVDPILEELDEDDEVDEDEDDDLFGELEEDEDLGEEELFDREHDHDEEDEGVLVGHGNGSSHRPYTPQDLLALVLAAEAERPDHRTIGRRAIAQAVSDVAESWTAGRDIQDARRLIAAHEHIVAIWDELPNERLPAAGRARRFSPKARV